MCIRRLAAVLAVTCLATVAGCGSIASPAAQDDKIEVIASFYPLEFLSSRIGGDEVAVTGLTAPGAEPHDLELSPRRIASLSKADLVVYEAGFQAAVDDAITTAKPERSVDVSQGVELLPLVAEAGNDEADHDESGNEPGVNDPHIWLDPANMEKMADAVTEGLIEAKPEAEATFTANNAALQSGLEALDSEFKAGLKTCQRREFITTHAAFGYLAARYDLKQIAINGVDPESEPSPARIAEIHDEASKQGVTTIFYETLVSPAVAESVAGDLGLKTAVLDPIEGLTDESAGRDYLAVMQANLAALTAANGCR